MPTLAYQDSTAWTSSTSTTLNVNYPTSAADATASANDQLYLYVHVKPDTATITPSGSWTHVATVTGGSGATGTNDTGPTKFAVYKRSILSSLTSNTPVTLSGQSVAQGCMVQYRPSASSTWTDQVVNASISSGTSLAGTAGSSTTILTGDHVGVFFGAASDAATAQTPSTVAASGATFGSVTASPGNGTSSGGFQIASYGAHVKCTAGSSTGTLSTTGTGTGTSTRQVVFHVVSVGGDGAIASAQVASVGVKSHGVATAAIPAPLAAYSFDEGSGTTVNDKSGNGKNFSLTSTNGTFGTGKTNTGLTKSGSGSMPVVGSPAFGQTTNRTLMCWFKGTGATWIIRWQVDSIDSGAWGILHLAGTALGQVRSSSTVVRPGLFTPDGNWNHYALTYLQSSGAASFYVNGVLSETLTITGPLRTDADRIDVLEMGTGNTMDDLRIFDSALSVGQIRQLMDIPVTEAATTASAGGASVSVSGQAAAVNTSSAPSIGSAAVGMAAQNASVRTSISRTPGVPTIGLAAQDVTLSTTISRTAGFATPGLAAEPVQAITVSTSVPVASFGMAAHNAAPSTAATQAPAGVAALGLAAADPTIKVSPVVGSATVAVTAYNGFVFGGATAAGGLAAFTLSSPSASPSVKVSAALASIGLVAQPITNSDQSIACADFVTVVVVDEHFAAVGVEAHTTSMTVDEHSATVVADQHYANAEVCGRS